MTVPGDIENESLLERFFAQSMDGFFFMMLDEPVEWGDHVSKDKVLDYVFEHQRMTKVNPAILAQFKAAKPEDLLGATPAQLLAHDLPRAKATWREFFDRGHIHTETDERTLDGTPIRIEGDYMVLYDDRRRIAGHFGIQRDVTDRYLSTEQLEASRSSARARVATAEGARRRAHEVARESRRARQR